jgi:hypothetical protein
VDDYKELERRVKNLEAKQQTLYESTQEAVMTARNPMGMVSRFERFETLIEQINKTQAKINADLVSLMSSSKYVELFSNEEIRNYYMNTDKTVAEIEYLIKQHFPESTFTTVTIQNYVNGNCPDVHIRSFLGKYLRNEANTKAKKVKQTAGNPK